MAGVLLDALQMSGGQIVQLDLKSLDENYRAAKDASPAERLKDKCAASVREGRRREKAEWAPKLEALQAEHAGFVAGMKEAHQAETARIGKIISRAAHRDGMLWGVVVGMATAIALAFGTWLILREVVITNVATERVPRSAVPALADSYTEPGYEHHPREPGDAGN